MRPEGRTSSLRMSAGVRARPLTGEPDRSTVPTRGLLTSSPSAFVSLNGHGIRSDDVCQIRRDVDVRVGTGKA